MTKGTKEGWRNVKRRKKNKCFKCDVFGANAKLSCTTENGREKKWTKEGRWSHEGNNIPSALCVWILEREREGS